MIHFRGVTKTFGSKVVLHNLNLDIPKGSITFIIGRSGEGKSVTIKHMMGLMRPTAGRITVDQQDVLALTESGLRKFRRNFGLLFQNGALFDSMTVRENILFPLREHGDIPIRDHEERVRYALNQVGLPEALDRYPSALSTGEKKRVGLARALVARPKILLYDEPTTGMDPFVSEMIDELIVKVSQDEPELTSVVISHDLKAALVTAHHIIMLYKGSVVAEGAPEFFHRTNDPLVRQFFSGKPNGPMEFF